MDENMEHVQVQSLFQMLLLMRGKWYTVLPQQYTNMNDQYNHPDLLKAFKSNPYAQPLNSVA